MLTRLSIEGFRAFEQLEVQDMGRVTLVTGRNNAGKTALLEAIYLLLGRTNVELIPRLMVSRGLDVVESTDPQSVEHLLWDYLFHDLDTGRPITIAGDVEGVRRKVTLSLETRLRDRLTTSVQEIDSGATFGSKLLRAEYRTPGKKKVYWAELMVQGSGLGTKKGDEVPAEPRMQGIYITTRKPSFRNEDAERFSRLAMAPDGVEEVLAALRVIEPNLTKLMLLHLGGRPMLYGDIGMREMVPLSYMGDGMMRLASLLTSAGGARSGILLIDEVDTGFHHTTLRDMWRLLDEASVRFDTQIIATTHSLECVRSASEWFGAKVFEDNGFRLVRVDRVNDRNRAVSYGPEELGAALESDLEVR